ncbi:hypothetical protein CK489_32525 [Bradyrhizobium sp. UFLA03-84]|nr:hypothetical protein CK489_32525 [Bradyrhizobium sp. UFLA03-84]
MVLVRHVLVGNERSESDHGNQDCYSKNGLRAHVASLNSKVYAPEITPEGANVKQMFRWVLIGTLIILSLTTVLAKTSLGAGQDEDVLFAIQAASLLASITAAAGLLGMLNRPDTR